jgi:hypothetical protein
VCDVGIASYTVFMNGTWQDAGLAPSADDGGAGKVRDGGGWCQANSELDFGDPSVQLGGCRIQVRALVKLAGADNCLCCRCCCCRRGLA